MTGGAEGGDRTDYSSYLLIDDLLRLQRPLTEGADDELLFIVVHQAYELWFKLLLHELGLARDHLLQGACWLATPRLRRAVAIDELLLGQLKVLETMSPEGFLAFRDPLAPASGFQSEQFREIELLSGGGPPPTGGLHPGGETADRLARQRDGPTLWEATLRSLAAHDLLAREPGPAGPALVRQAVGAIYGSHDDPVRAHFHELFELLVDHDEALARWRHHHMMMAAREIGRRPGTGGSLGVAYLEQTVAQRFYPVLWEIRSELE